MEILQVKRNWVFGLVVLSLWTGLTWMHPLRGQDQESHPPGASAAFEQLVQPFVANYCLTCHNETLLTANLNLAQFQDGAAAAAHPDVWAKVLEKLSSGRMPPPGMPAPDRSQINRISAWIDGLLSRTGFSPEVNPGRVTARRLNRVEYNNTIRDLLGVHVRPADDFPVDDSGYGFDNIGDVLTVSPMLIEKFMAAAKQVSRLAVYGEAFPPQPVLLAKLMAKRSYDGGSLSGSNYLPYSMRGNLYGTFNFPVDAEYELRFRVMNLRPDIRDPNRTRRKLDEEELRALEEQARRAAPPVKVVLSLDGEPILTDVIEGTTTFGYDRGEFVARVSVKAGPHLLRASFPELADLEDPREHLNPDLRRKIFVDYLDVVGPFEPATDPPESYRRIFVCGHPPDAHGYDCGGKIITQLGYRAYRRPVTEEELSGLLRLVTLAEDKGDSFEEGVRVALQAILVSPHFLFRIERDADSTEGAEESAHPISEYELASRLSYFLWASMPDDELLRAAEGQRLRSPGVLEAQVRRMLADRRSMALVETFAEQWLQLRNLDRQAPDPERFPVVDDELLEAMRRETHLFVEEFIREDRSIPDLLDAPFTFLNGPLARHYGIPGIRGEEFQRVSLDGDQRGGLLTQASILTVSSYPTRTSPVMRGKWVLETLLGTPPPPPPPDVPELEESEIGLSGSMRQQMEQHRANPSCSACHKVMDPLGFGLENYDAAGAWRTHDGNFPIDASGLLPDGRAFSGPRELKVILKEQSDLFTRNLTEKLLTYALGRGLESFDSGTVGQISSRLLENDHRFSVLVLEIIRSDPFQMRGSDGGN